MPVEFPTGQGEPRAELVTFVHRVQEFLDELVDSNRDPFGNPLFYPELLELMRGAWGEGRPEVERVAILIRNAPLDRLGQHGLTGRQLRFKLGVIGHFNRLYISTGKSYLRKLLEVVDILLKSILEAVGAGGALSELKEYIEKSLDD